MTNLSSEYWRERAEETRAKAECSSDKSVRDKLVRVSAQFEQLARRAAKWRTVENEDFAHSMQALFVSRLFG
jgi:hypothetical protein